MPKAGWLFLSVGQGVELAISSSSVHRVLHGGSPEFGAYAAEAVNLAEYLGVESDPGLPSVIVVLQSGAAWLAGDASLQRESEAVRYLSLRAGLLRRSPPWCRGIIEGGTRWAYVVEEAAIA